MNAKENFCQSTILGNDNTDFTVHKAIFGTQRPSQSARLFT